MIKLQNLNLLEVSNSSKIMPLLLGGSASIGFIIGRKVTKSLENVHRDSLNNTNNRFIRFFSKTYNFLIPKNSERQRFVKVVLPDNFLTAVQLSVYLCFMVNLDVLGKNYIPDRQEKGYIAVLTTVGLCYGFDFARTLIADWLPNRLGEPFGPTDYPNLNNRHPI